MISENEARRLLAAAADTVEVRPTGPIAVPRRRRWPALAAAAVLVVVAGTGLAFGLVREDGRGGSGPATVTDPPAPVERSARLAPDQLPSVLGLEAAAARVLLEERGLVVTERARPDGCQPPGIVTGSVPAFGTRVARGDRVTLLVTAEQVVIDCVGEPRWALVWQLLAFARGDGPPPRTAPTVELYAGARRAQVPADALEDPDRWVVCDASACHSALAALAAQVSTPFPTGDGAEYWPQEIVVAQGPAALGRCPAFTPEPELPEHLWWSEQVFVAPGGTERGACPDTTVQLYTDEHGRLAGVGLRLRASVTGDPLTEGQRGAADQLTAFADGDLVEPVYHREVELLLDDRVVDALEPSETQDRDSWAMCSGVAPTDCQVSALRVLAAYDGAARVGLGIREDCGARRLPPALGDGAEQVVRLEPPGPPTCAEPWVEIWLAGAGEIRAVGLVLPPID